MARRRRRAHGGLGQDVSGAAAVPTGCCSGRLARRRGLRPGETRRWRTAPTSCSGIARRCVSCRRAPAPPPRPVVPGVYGAGRPGRARDVPGRLGRCAVQPLVPGDQLSCTPAAVRPWCGRRTSARRSTGRARRDVHRRRVGKPCRMALSDVPSRGLRAADGRHRNRLGAVHVAFALPGRRTPAPRRTCTGQPPPPP